MTTLLVSGSFRPLAMIDSRRSTRKMMSIEVPSRGARLGSAGRWPGLSHGARVTEGGVADGQSDRVGIAPDRAMPQRRPSALLRRPAAAAGIISDTSPPNEAISLTSEED